MQRLGSIFDMDLEGVASPSKGSVLDLPTLPILVPIIRGELTLKKNEDTRSSKKVVDINELISMEMEVGRGKMESQTPSTNNIN